MADDDKDRDPYVAQRPPAAGKLPLEDDREPDDPPFSPGMPDLREPLLPGDRFGQQMQPSKQCAHMMGETPEQISKEDVHAHANEIKGLLAQVAGNVPKDRTDEVLEVLNDIADSLGGLADKMDALIAAVKGSVAPAPTPAPVRTPKPSPVVPPPAPFPSDPNDAELDTADT